MSWYREPLVHFLALGAVLFALYAVFNQADQSSLQRIEVTAGDIQHLQTIWERQWQRPPTAAELQGLIEAHIREEVLYREALAMGLDRDDTIIRRRLAQKLEFLMQDMAALRQPTDAELATFFAAQGDRYRLPVRLSFTHVYFNAHQRGPAAEHDAREALARLRAAPVEGAASELGDPSLLESEQRRKTEDEVGQLFGRDFAAALLTLTPGDWHGPLASAYGWHLVQVQERTPARLPGLAEVQERVQQDWADEQRRQTNAELLQRLRQRYDIIVAPLTLAPAAATTTAVIKEATR
jgi:peptidyl-prolyl cis-trans isomerase C